MASYPGVRTSAPLASLLGRGGDEPKAAPKAKQLKAASKANQVKAAAAT